MPFSSPSQLSVSVLQADIDNATTSKVSAQVALERLAAASQLPGLVVNDIQPCGGIIVDIDAYLSGTYGIYLCNIFVCTDNYIGDPILSTVAAEKVGVKPTAPYSFTMNKA